MANTSMIGVLPRQASVTEVSLRNRNNGLGKPIEECSNRLIGAYGKDLACAYLRSQGYRILERGWTCKFGIVDVVYATDDVVCLAEVRTQVGHAGERLSLEDCKVGTRRRTRFERLALFYLSKHIDYDVARFDVIVVRLADEYEASLSHFAGAYEVSC